jgi:predicted methyltransferase
MPASEKLQAVLAARVTAEQARDDARHPQQTLTFFGIEPGMKVAEALPGGGWYTKILAPYVGSAGAIYGVNYQDRVWTLFGWDAERIAGAIEGTSAFPGQVAEWAGDDIPALGFAFDSVPSDVDGTVDAVLLIRALHNLHRFKDSGVLDEALQATYDMLKPGGVVGVVQHRAPESASDAWASGQNGYLKATAVKALLEGAGFLYEASSAVNANPKDQPGEKDIVWRLPPSYAGGEESKAAVDLIGESDRMTLRFRKPG